MAGIGKKKFQLDVAAPSETEVKQIQKVEAKMFAPPKITLKKVDSSMGKQYLNPSNGLTKGSLNQLSNASLNEKRVADEFVRPIALKEKT